MRAATYDQPDHLVVFNFNFGGSANVIRVDQYRVVGVCVGDSMNFAIGRSSLSFWVWMGRVAAQPDEGTTRLVLGGSHRPSRMPPQVTSGARSPNPPVRYHSLLW
jgi:hypothetical protein